MKGFTLIELLIVVVIISIISGIIILGFDQEIDFADDGTTKLRVVAISTHALEEEYANPAPTGNAICNNIYNERKDKEELHECWGFNGTTTIMHANDDMCRLARHTDKSTAGTLYCSSHGTEWVIWGRYKDFNYRDPSTKNTNDIFCVDDDGFSEDIDLNYPEGRKFGFLEESKQCKHTP